MTGQVPTHSADGSRIFTHLPPVDTYNSTLAAFELAKAQRQYAEQGHGTLSLVPFGYGDGGGGPNREMLAKAHRTADLEGSPRVRVGTVHDFFAEAEAELDHPHTWSGEMYLETHRGTYTSQLRTKQGNRRSEHLLRAAELWATTAAIRTGLDYPADELHAVWETVLLQQFHDILPGSSIAWVHREAEANYTRVAQVLEGIIDRSLAALVGGEDGADGEASGLLVNSAPVELDGVPALSVESVGPDRNGDRSASGSDRVTVQPDDGGWLVDTGAIRVRIDADGLIPSVLHLATKREAVADGRTFGLLQAHNDRPSMYEAWDIDGHINRMVTDLTEAESVRLLETDANLARFEVVRRLRGSTITEVITLRGGSAAIDFDFTIDWHEQRTLLKLAFPTSVFCDRAASEIQFGHIHRPTHSNTAWDVARHETVAHRWVQVAEPTFGVAVANDSTYGHDIRRDHSGVGAPGTTVRLSLLRGPKFPDPDTDQGEHRLRVSIVVGADLTAAIRAGQRLNQPLRRLPAGSAVAPIVQADADGVLVEAVKLAEDGSGDVVVRLYESVGARAVGTLRAGFDFDDVLRTDLLERTIDPQPALVDGGVRLDLRPFEIVTLRFAGVRAS